MRPHLSGCTCAGTAMSEMVKIFDDAACCARQIPKCELLGDEIAVEIEGLGQVHLTPAQMTDCSGPWHRDLHPILEPQIAFITKTFAEVTGATLNDWTDGFLRDFRPSESVREFVRLARAYLKMTTALEPTDLRRKKEIFNSLVCTD